MKHIKLFEDVMPKLSTDGSLDSVIITSTSTGQNNFFIGINKPVVEGEWAPLKLVKSRYTLCDGNFVSTMPFRSENRIFSDLDPYGEENWDER